MSSRVVPLNARDAVPVREHADVGGGVPGRPAAEGEAGEKKGVFVTTESLTFPAATVVTSTALALLGSQVDGAETNLWYALLVSALVGAAIIYLGMPKTDVGKHVVVGLINIVMLTATTLGVSSLGSEDPVTTDAPTASSRP